MREGSKASQMNKDRPKMGKKGQRWARRAKITQRYTRRINLFAQIEGLVLRYSKYGPSYVTHSKYTFDQYTFDQ